MASPKVQRIQAVINSISIDIKLYQQLLELLREQKSIYLTFDSVALNDNVAQQIPILNQLSHHATERSLHLRKLGLPIHEHSVQRICNALPSELNIKARNQWTYLKSLIHECHQLNQSNGQSSAAFHEIMHHIKHPTQHTYEEQRF
ncbi:MULTISPECIES: flagellar protein FlgN [unclassified Vibrio]|uniref:flagellar protein FlgN n=1 Tax=unclassified Vibrio TaxID=2614977 RepID=UPI0014830502|nr:MULTISPECIES: flagellar protein FlgN [unclassified Vibrio]NNN44334.1 flagellar protein FlgN [Vibrio sp. 1-1(7)]NNN72850.1 flagellar protein FlgN [Vibrio sp. 12-2(3-a)]